MATSTERKPGGNDVLLLGGDESTRASLADGIAAANLGVEQAASVHAASERLANTDYGVVVVAVDRLDKRAAEQARALREAAGPLLPILLVESGAARRRSRSIPVLPEIEVLAAPLDPALLASRIGALVERTRLLQEVIRDRDEKARFLGMVAHELRAPLSVAIGYLAMIQEESFGRLPHGLSRAVEVITIKIGEIQSLVEDLLIASRLDGGEMQLRQEPLDLNEQVTAALTRLSPRALEMEAQLSYQPVNNVSVIADRRYLGRILDNLLNNALTYSEGRPWIRVVVRNHEVPRVRVEDHGIGIPAELKGRIFQRGSRGNDADPRRPGTGLGLYVSRELARRQNGSLELVGSEVGGGSTFELRLPAAGAA